MPPGGLLECIPVLGYLMVTGLAAIPQSILILYASLGLVGIRTTLRDIMVPGIILGVVISTVRFVPVLMGWHIAIFLAVYLLLTQTFRLASVLCTLTAVALAFMLVTLADIILVVPVWYLAGITSYPDVIANWPLFILLGWVESSMLILGALAVKRWEFVLLPIARWEAGHKSGGASS